MALTTNLFSLINIGDNVIDTTDKIEVILDKTNNSIEVSQTKLSDKGINCSNWFTKGDFNRRFKYIK